MSRAWEYPEYLGTSGGSLGNIVKLAPISILCQIFIQPQGTRNQSLAQIQNTRILNFSCTNPEPLARTTFWDRNTEMSGETEQSQGIWEKLYLGCSIPLWIPVSSL